jgi:hypothetical protein
MAIGHGWATAEPDEGKDVDARNLNNHIITSDFDIAGGVAIPAAPDSGKARMYVMISGVSPAKSIKIGFLLEDNTNIVIAEATI